MPITFHIDPAKRWLEMKCLGVVTPDEAVDAVRRLFEHPDYSDDYYGIIDCREMENVLDVTDLRGLAEMQLARPGPVWRARRAVVVGSPAQYGTASVFMLFAESGPVQFNVFYNMEAALKWLKE